MKSTSPSAVQEGVLRLNFLGQEGDILHASCEGGISLPTFHQENDPLVKLLGPEVYRCLVVLDLERASYLDTSGITWLIRHHTRFREAGGVMVLHSIPPRVQTVLALLHMQNVLHTASDLQAALALARGGAK
jgi:anti-anti-sigma factor